MPNNKEPQVTKPRGREIQNGISHKCATGRCNDLQFNALHARLRTRDRTRKNCETFRHPASYQSGKGELTRNNPVRPSRRAQSYQSFKTLTRGNTSQAVQSFSLLYG
jgi:hypothetical protein